MKHTLNQVEEKEDDFYVKFLDKAIGYANNEKGTDGVQFRQLVAAAGVVAKQRQTRGAMKALTYQITRDTGRGLLPKPE
ncbi:MAG: hypothetical protein WC269_06575 [Candidatus Gracilibacteria bacterium]|jgi:hypothetical protein